MFNIDVGKYLGALKNLIGLLTGFMDQAVAILGIISSLLDDEVIDFIDTLMAKWDKIIGKAKDPAEKEALKAEAHYDVVSKVSERYSSSPKWIPSAFVHTYIKMKKFIENGDDSYSERAKAHKVFKKPETNEDYQNHMRRLGIG